MLRIGFSNWTGMNPNTVPSGAAPAVPQTWAVQTRDTSRGMRVMAQYGPPVASRQPKVAAVAPHGTVTWREKVISGGTSSRGRR